MSTESQFRHFRIAVAYNMFFIKYLISLMDDGWLLLTIYYCFFSLLKNRTSHSRCNKILKEACFCFAQDNIMVILHVNVLHKTIIGWWDLLFINILDFQYLIFPFCLKKRNSKFSIFYKNWSLKWNIFVMFRNGLNHVFFSKYSFLENSQNNVFSL
jgi:hypothetical protein